MRVFKLRLLTLLMVLSLILSLGAAVPTGASADTAVIGKILTTISATPVALDDPASITAATSTAGCRIVSAGWYAPNGALVTGAFGVETYTLVINIAANDGYAIAPDAACYLNNSAINCVVDPFGSSATLTRDYTAAVWAPTIYKNPGDETVDEGGWASFVVSGAYVVDYEWSLVPSSGTGAVPVGRLRDSYSTLEYTGDGTSKLNLYHIPYELNGWQVVCSFIGAGDGNVKRSQPATLTVRPSPARAAAEAAPTPAAEASPSPTITPVSVTSPVTSSEIPEPPAAEPAYSNTWSFDARGHWHASLDGGAAADEALHSFTWTEVQPETDTQPRIEQGVCDVCGYTATRRTGGPVTADTVTVSSGSGEDTNPGAGFLDRMKEAVTGIAPPSTLMILLLALLPVDLLLVVIHLCGPAKQRQPRRRRRR